MATLSQLVTAISSAEGIDAERVTAIARAVREEGLIKTSGRGTSAAQMDERDAANLLIAANTADTARTAPDMVKQYRALQAKRGKQKSDFGSELEELLLAAKRELLADYVTRAVALVGTRGHILGKRRYPNEAYEFEITFEKPVAAVFLHVAAQTRLGLISFHDRQANIDAAGDRRESTKITQRTIFAVANVLPQLGENG
ncbi:hypothetical protein [Bradyrhizobium sp. DASA03120]|uniref:hypothetical protein n=1 Tax=Bradyrhizobium sp. SMVTL-02 TaxID=3395917 RepID=UPI003F710F24